MYLRHSLPFLFLVASVFLSGCFVSVTNLTPPSLPQNPSNVYTFSFSGKGVQPTLIPGSKRASIVISGETYRMKEDPKLENIFSFDYQMPPKANQAKYYYVFEYNYLPDSKGNSEKEKKYVKYSDVYTLKLINQYVLQLESSRGPVGSRIHILGRNFSQGDTIFFDRQPVVTEFHSPTTLSFQVPPAPAEASYQVSIRTIQANYIDAGRFWIDQAKINVTPAVGGRLDVRNGGITQVVFSIDFKAPHGGLPIDVTTDIPKSIIMEEVIIPEGQRSITIPIRGGSNAKGSLFVEASGFGLTRVPITVF